MSSHSIWRNRNSFPRNWQRFALKKDNWPGSHRNMKNCWTRSVNMPKKRKAGRTTDLSTKQKMALSPPVSKRRLKQKSRYRHSCHLEKSRCAHGKRKKSEKKQLKDDFDKLHIQTKKTIEALSDEQMLLLLKLKWITPLVSSINSLPQTVISEFISRLESLCKKYDTTYAEVERKINKTERSLIGLLDELQGNEFGMQELQEFKKLLGGE